MPGIGRFFDILLKLRNQVDYPLRQALHLGRSGLRFTNESKQDLYSHLPPARRRAAEKTERRLRQQYHLEALYQHSTADNYRENLYYLDLLEKALQAAGDPLPSPLAAADIGPSHWFYVQALWAALCWWDAPQERQVDLTGYEVDAYRLYADFRSRLEHARAHLEGLPGSKVRCLPQGFSRQPGRFDFIAMLFPFVFLHDHLEWGLPQGLFDPFSLLQDAWDSLKPGGVLLIINQGQEEHEAQARMLSRLESGPGAALVQTAFQHHSDLYHYDIPRFVLVCRHG